MTPRSTGCCGSFRGGPPASRRPNIAERHTVWQSTPVVGPLSAVGSGDVDGDGAVETVLISYPSADGVGPGIIHVFDGVTHELEWTGAAPPGTWDGGHVRSVIVANVDADPRDEIVYTYSDVDGKVVVLDGAARTVKRASASFHGNLFSALAAADVDGDGAVEIVAGQGRGAYGDAPGVFLLVFDGATMAEEWRSADLGIAGGSVSDIAVGCVDGDGRTEIVAVTSGGKAYVYDAVTHHLDWIAEQKDHVWQSGGLCEFSCCR